MPFEPSEAIRESDWWTSVLHPFARDVGSVIPDGFERYARVLHPVAGAGPDHTWTAVAEHNDRVAHPHMQFHAIAADAPPPMTQDQRLSWGSLPSRELQDVASILGEHTETPEDVWACVWYGYAHITFPVKRRVVVPQREYFLLHGTLADIATLDRGPFEQSPNVWWPGDRAWFVATEIDFAWTYVGGSALAVDDVLSDPRLEAFAAAPTDRFDANSDLVNVTTKR